MIDKNNVANIFPLTPLQEGMLYSEIASGGDAYLMQTSLRIEGELDIEAFHRAWEMLVERHEALRTLVSPDGADRPLQVALKRLAIPLPFTDLSGLEDEEKEKELDRFRTKERETRFELKRPPLFRIALFRTAPARHILVLTFHHISWTAGVRGFSMRNFWPVFMRCANIAARTCHHRRHSAGMSGIFRSATRHWGFPSGKQRLRDTNPAAKPRG